MKLKAIAQLLGGYVEDDPAEIEIGGVSTLAEGGIGDIAPVIGKHGVLKAQNSNVSALLVGRDLAHSVGQRPRIIVENPGAAAQLLEERFLALAEARTDDDEDEFDAEEFAEEGDEGGDSADDDGESGDFADGEGESD